MDNERKAQVAILGTGSYLPERVVTNDEVAPGMGSSDEWIFTHTGIHSRHWAAPEESSSTLGAVAGRRALEAAGLKPEDVNYILCATSTPDYGNFPSTACLVQKHMGCVNAAALDVSAACSGFAYALEMGRCYVLAHPDHKVLVLGTEVLSRSVDWTERTVSMLFGDGAGAVVLGARPEGFPETPCASLLGADGTGYEAIYREGGLKEEPRPDMPIPYMKMQGRAVFNFAVKKLDSIITDLCTQAGVDKNTLSRIFPHQANARIIEAVARRAELPLEKFFCNLETIGNTSTASIPLCLDQAVRSGELKPGDRIALAGFGSGLTWAGMLMTWPSL